MNDPKLIPVANVRRNPPFSIQVIDKAGNSQQNQNHVNSTSNFGASEFLSYLPAAYRTSKDVLELPYPDELFLQRELNLGRLNDVHEYLWLAGWPMPPRPLHFQKALGREIVPMEQMDMHLVWLRSQIFIKPLPRYLLESEFWKEHLTCLDRCTCSVNPERQCERRQIYGCALGLLLSYVALITHESDYHLARDHRLLPYEVTWNSWRLLVRELLQDKTIHNRVNKRFVYGELRLGRLNKMYRYTGRSVRHGYRASYTVYGAFFSDNFAWLASALAYIAIVLTAMQVGLGTDKLQGDSTFQAVSYGFTVFSIVAPIAAVVIVMSVVTLDFARNFVAAMKYKKCRSAPSDLTNSLVDS